MARFSKDELKALTEVRQTLCVSMYLPLETGNTLSSTQQLRSLLDRASRMVQEIGMSSEDATVLFALRMC
jgi:hypothetical protein